MLVEAKDFESYLPIFDARRLSKPGVLHPRSRNFVFDVDGPRSAWASRFANYWQFDFTTRHLIKEFKVEDEYFYGTPTGIYRVNPVSLAVEVSLPITTLRRYWPWSFAKVGNRHYFAQHNVGLWEWNNDDGIWTEVETPEPVKFICLAYGRLMCLGENIIFYSELDDGRDFTAVAGNTNFQVLSILSKDAFRIDPVADGVIVSTRRGLIKGEKVEASYLFRWYVLSRAVFTFSPNMGCIIPDIGLVTLDESGFHITNGQIPEPWEPAASEFFKRTFIGQEAGTKSVSSMDRARIGCCRLDYLPSSGEFFASFAANNREGTFTQSFVYKKASGKWGRFDWPHHGFFEVNKTPYNIDTPAYMDQWGFMQRIDEVQNKEIAPPSLLDLIVRPRTEPAPRIEVDIDGNTVITGITELWLSPEEGANSLAQITAGGLFTVVETCYSDAEEIDQMDPDWVSA
jgi:hypothetical protein